ncbi:MAG: phage major capsid protein [Rhodobacteraceae bacterium]|nr:phage major capsid protein [Paracoccaceae bacterium]
MPTPHIAAELAHFAGDLRTFRANLETKIAHQSARLDVLDRKDLSRPSLGQRGYTQAAHPHSPHAKAIAAYLRSGDDSALRALNLESKALSVAADGGYLVDPLTAETIASTLRGASSIRALASVAAVDAGAYDVLIDQTEMGAGWQVEATPTAETSTPGLDRISITLHELSALPKVSQRLLDDSAFDLEAWLAERIAERFARAENAAFVSGDGVNQPRGFLDHTVVNEASWSWDNIGYIPTGVDGAFPASDPADVLLDLIYNLGAQYRRNAHFLMNSATAGAVRKFKDADGRYLWSEPLVAGQPPLLFGYPVVIVEEMPGIASSSLSIAFGDFRAGYTIAERPDLRLLRDPYSAKPNVLFYATKRVGGDVTDFAAIKLLRFSAS